MRVHSEEKVRQLKKLRKKGYSINEVLHSLIEQFFQEATDRTVIYLSPRSSMDENVPVLRD